MRDYPSDSSSGIHGRPSPRPRLPRDCERFEGGPVSRAPMESVYRESLRIASILATNPDSEALVIAKYPFHAELIAARRLRKTRNDCAFVTRLRWAEQWIEVGLVSSRDLRVEAFERAVCLLEDAKLVYLGQSSPECTPPKTPLPPLAGPRG